MSALIIDGKAVAREVREGVARSVAELRRPPGLATVLVGEDPASAIYVANKRKLCTAAGIRDLHRQVPADIAQGELEALVEELNGDEDVDGILVQLPLPDHLEARAVVDRIDPAKDVDGLTTFNAGLLAQGRQGLQPCTPAGVMLLLEQAGIDLAGKHAVVIGRSDLVGRPMAQLLTQANATVTVCHSRTKDLVAETSRADVLIAAAGVPRLIGADHVQPGATVIDVGIHRTDTGMCGDVDFDEVREVAGALTPVPGGVGPMTIALLLRNTVQAASRREEMSP
ncbi:bifunctional methylenetetrahydrofolate dehydrogenase/methenyltetrahydrofolate cyclohydrolase FolD [Nocardioides sp. NBC_00163]|uniref:bifunctional methylenetetrahydrofolate dehydrogenase/methenyltetrahydrofolate cyclohydrolase FolD n=1 Tax=Nocardioides sp. NBC_00163 TaxID=2975999 RepID=UPI003251881C